MSNDTAALVAVQKFDRLARILIPSIFGLIIAIGLVGNLLVILVVATNQKMRSTANILIVNLAVADVLFIILCVPFTAVGYVEPVYPFGNSWCKFQQYMIFVCAFASVYTLVLLSFDRYLGVVHVIRSITLRNKKNIYIVVFFMWLIILLANVPLIFEHRVKEYDFRGQNKSICLQVTDRRIFYGAFFGFGFLIPLLIVCSLYGLLLKRLLYGVLPGGCDKSTAIIRAKRGKRVTRMVIVVVAVFAMCWLPIHVIFLISSFGNPTPSLQFLSVQMAANCLAYMNSCMNPIIYAFFSDNFRKGFRKLLCCFSP